MKYPYRQDISRKALIAAAAVSLLAAAGTYLFILEKPGPATAAADRAARTMQRCLTAIRTHCRSAGIPLEKKADPNRTWLIGPEQTPITTTLGHLDAKRTATNPRTAGLITELLIEAGVTEGDRVAIGSSGSFPGLMIASVCAVQALQAEPVIILSCGSSSFGATRPEFTLIDMYQLLFDKGIFTRSPAGISLGGRSDIGEEFPDTLRTRLIAELSGGDIHFIYEPRLQENLKTRMAIYRQNETAAFINCGGGFANMGTSSRILYVKPGLNRNLNLPPEKTWGTIFAMAAADVPVIHLLFIKGLAARYGLIWDPVPLPEAGHTGVRRVPKRKRTMFFMLFGLYLGGLAALIAGEIRPHHLIHNS